MMGVVLILYLNSPPIEPRERDYIYVGSFYAFAIWAGLGVLAIAHGIGKATKNLSTGAVIATLITLPVPGLMGAQNWTITTERDATSLWIRLETSWPLVLLTRFSSPVATTTLPALVRAGSGEFPN